MKIILLAALLALMGLAVAGCGTIGECLRHGSNACGIN